MQFLLQKAIKEQALINFLTVNLASRIAKFFEVLPNDVNRHWHYK